MKSIIKILKYFLVIIAFLIALSYAFGYSYLMKGIWITYLHGNSGATIDDGKMFPKHEIIAAKPIIWEKDSLYNKKILPPVLIKNLKESNTVSFLIIKNGKLLHEEYWEGYNQYSKTNSFSMAKTITIMLLGKAIDDKAIKNIDQKYSDFYGSYSDIKFGKNLTLKNLASMEAGLKWNENYNNPLSPNAKAYYGNSLAEAVLFKSFKEKPGSKFEYQSGATQLLGFAIEKAVNQPLSSYLSQKIWIPLGMEQTAYWSTDENGMEKTFCCLHSDSRDYAKLGLLLLNKGKINNLQVLNPNFIQQMLTPSKLSNGVYGLGIWINNDSKIKHYYFQGLYGQFIIIIPEKQIVIVKTGFNKNQKLDSKGRPVQAEFIANQVVKNFQ